MGTDRKAVVDPRTMKLKSNGLWVDSCNSRPDAGDLNTPTLMIAERAADLIKGEVLSEDVLAWEISKVGSLDMIFHQTEKI